MADRTRYPLAYDIREKRRLQQTEDSISIFALGPPGGRGVRCIEFIGRRRELPSDDPAIW